MNLKKGDVPEFPLDGLNVMSGVGSNVNSIQYPSIFRQLSQIFAKDDTLSSFTLKSISTNQDVVFLDFEINTKLNEIIEQKLSV